MKKQKAKMVRLVQCGLLVMLTVMVFRHATPNVQAQQSNAASSETQPDFVILLIGDGMAQSQRELATALLREREKNNEAKLAMDTLDVHQLIGTKLHQKYITDSAAAGTAIATGQETGMGVISMNGHKNKSLETVVDVAQKRGMKIGLISDVSMDHATPAVFYAHRASRNDYREISEQLATSDIDFIGGGGLRGAQGEGGDAVIKGLKDAGYKLIRDRGELQRLIPGPKVYAMSPVLGSAEEMISQADDTTAMSLQELTRSALKVLHNEQGFFLMVEGGVIDWRCHANELSGTARRMLEFDQAVAEALAFYQRHPKRTLLIVVGDHETGALKKLPEAGSDVGLLDRHDEATRTRMVQTISRLSKQNAQTSDLLAAVAEVLKCNPTAEEKQAVTDLYSAYLKAEGKKPRKKAWEALIKGAYQWVEVRAGFQFRSYGHSGQRVVMSLHGVGADQFQEAGELYELGQVMKKLLRENVVTE